MLMDNANSALRKHGSKFPLVVADVQAAFHDGVGVEDLSFQGGDAASSGTIGGESDSLAVLQRSPFVAESTGSVMRSALNPSLSKDAPDNNTIDADALGDGLLRFSPEIILDRIVSAGRINFSGHVYNLQTESGHYIVHGVVTHNCECVTTASASDGTEE
jgi:hypothetical protein